MKFTNEKLHEIMSFHARGKGNEAEIRFQFYSWDRGLSESLELDEARQLLKVIQDAITDCERRKLLKDED